MLRGSSLIYGRIQTLFGVGALGPLSDRQLLELFTARDGEVAELAFAALLERHGPMVMGVCRRILHDPEDAADAFQATFLILVRKAGAVDVTDSLGRWLYGVSRRVALQAKAASMRRPAQLRAGLEQVEAQTRPRPQIASGTSCSPRSMRKSTGCRRNIAQPWCCAISGECPTRRRHVSSAVRWGRSKAASPEVVGCFGRG